MMKGAFNPLSYKGGMEMILILNGLKMKEKYEMILKSENKKNGLHVKRIPRKNKKGEKKIHNYYYQRKRRTPEEIKKRLEEGKTNNLYNKDEYIGKTVPKDWLENVFELYHWYSQGENIIIESKGYERLLQQQRMADFRDTKGNNIFNDLVCYELKGEISNGR